MLEMLKNKELDIVFSKKVEEFENQNIKYISLGQLNDIFITNQKSNLAKKIVTIKELENSIIYVPRNYAQTVTRLNKLTNGIKLNLKNSSYNTILEVTSKSDAIGVITKEYVEKEKLEKYTAMAAQVAERLSQLKK